MISKLDELKVDFVIAAKSNQVINRELKNHQRKKSNATHSINYNNITCLKLKFKNLIANAIKLLNGSLFFEKCK